MTLAEILAVARTAGVRLQARGERLQVEAQPGTVTPALRAALVARKPELLGVLWRLEAMQRLAVEAPRAVVYARASAQGGPGFCFSCGDALEWPDAYGRCGPCDIASDLYYASRSEDDSLEVVA